MTNTRSTNGLEASSTSACSVLTMAMTSDPVDTSPITVSIDNCDAENKSIRYLFIDQRAGLVLFERLSESAGLSDQITTIVIQ